MRIADRSPRLGPDAPRVGTVSAEYQWKYFPSSHRGWDLGMEAFQVSCLGNAFIKDDVCFGQSLYFQIYFISHPHSFLCPFIML